MRRSNAFLMFLAMGAFTLGPASAADAASATVYTDRANWESAVGTFTEENFNDGTLNSEISVTSDEGGISNVPTTNHGNGTPLWDDRLESLDNETTTWTFADPIFAFGGEWDTAGPGNIGSGIQLTLDSFAVSNEVPGDIEDEFWGIVADFGFQNVLLEEGSQGGSAETYHVDDMVYANQTSQPPRSIPTPAAAPAGLALFGLLALRRRRDRASV